MAMEAQKSFNPNEHIMQIKSGQSTKDYLPVQWRLVWFRSAFPYGSIETEMLHLDMDREIEEEISVWNPEKRRSEKVMKRGSGFAVFKAVVKDGLGGVGTGTKSEKGVSFGDFIEKAETGAIGRALAALGYGTQFTDELDEGTRIVDSPVDNKSSKEQNPPASLSDIARHAREEMGQLRARVKEVQPKNKQGTMTFEQFYTSVTKNPFKSDRDVSVADRKLIKDQLDVIVRMRINPSQEEQTATS